MNPDQTRKNALEIFKAGVDAVDPVKIISKLINIKDHYLTVKDITCDLAAFENIYIIGAGKAAAAMAQPLEEILGNRLTEGMVIVKYGHTRPLKRIRIHEAGHPVLRIEGCVGCGVCLHACVTTPSSFELTYVEG